jgi:diaminopimelate decarboxylase
MMPEVKAGDLVAFRSAGAYAAVMASTYNSRDLLPEILVMGSDYALVSERVTIHDNLAREHIPGWLADPGQEKNVG